MPSTIPVPPVDGPVHLSKTPRRGRSPQFKVPVIPRRALAEMPPDNQAHSKLKRLSLVTKSTDGGTVASPRLSRIADTPDARAGEHGAGPSTPRTVGRGSRIGYSPSPVAGARAQRLDYGVGQSETQLEMRMGGVYEDAEEPRTGETIVERHADLLTLIAQKERRVNELRDELAAQEASLDTLKQRWTTLVCAQTPTSPGQIRPLRPPNLAPSSRLIPTASQSSISISNTSSDLSAVSATESESLPSLDQSIASLLSSIPIPASNPINNAAGKILNGEAMEGGKRFWDMMVKTVSAAAGGTVPDNMTWGGNGREPGTGSGSRGGGGGGVTGGRKTLRPANAARLSPSSEGTEGLVSTKSRKGADGASEAAAKCDLNEQGRVAPGEAMSGPEDLLGGADEVSGRTMTPRRPNRTGKSLTAPEHRKKHDEGDESGENGWGW